MRKKAVGKISVDTRRQMFNIGCKKDEFFCVWKAFICVHVSKFILNVRCTGYCSGLTN